MVSIAHANGYRSWEGIYHHPRNAALRSRCPNPAVLLPGEALFLPEKGAHVDGLATDRRHTFRVRSLEAWMRFTVGDQEQVFVGAPYVVTVDGVETEGITGADGMIALRVAPSARSAHVRVRPAGGEPVAWNVRIGHLDPPGTPSGRRSRLANLGYDAGEGDEQLAHAVAAFQHDHDLDATGTLDAGTMARLLALHGD